MTIYVPGRASERDVFPDDSFARRPSGLYAPERLKRRKERMIAIDLFAGAGGFSLGIMQAGIQVVAGLEWDPWATITYMCNLGAYPCQFHFDSDESRDRLEKALEKEARRDKAGEVLQMPFPGTGWIAAHSESPPGVEHFFFGDIRNFTGQQILDALGLERGEVDLVVGGPPCQGFSQAGKQNVMDPRNSLVFDFARLVLEILPTYMVMENVPEIARMVTPEGVGVIDALCVMLSKGGMGDYDTLKKGMEFVGGKPYLGARKTSKDQTAKKEDETEEPRQLSLFG